MGGGEAASLRVCLVSYRSNPHCGGQGVYLKNLSRSLRDLGHRVTVVSGPPDPLLDPGIPVHRPPCLDLYNPDDPFRVPGLRELLDPVSLAEWAGVSTAGFPEPFTFGLRAYRLLRRRCGDFDVLHDNQSLSYGIWAMARRLPAVATIHHPITRDREIAVASVRPFWKKLKHHRWYSFLGMQKRVARRLFPIITVSERAREDIGADFRVPAHRFRVVPNGIDTDLFYPLPGIEREPNRLIVTNSADMPLKGLFHLLRAMAILTAREGRDVRLTVIGTPKKDGGVVRLIHRLGIGDRVSFTGRVDPPAFLRHYAAASAAVVPSVYEGFGLPAGEAMACGVPVVATTGGALPEVVGDAGLLVPPADADALARAIGSLLDDPSRAEALGRAGYARVHRCFTWREAARQTAEVYREAIDAHRRP